MSNHHPPLRLCDESYSDERYVQRITLELTISRWLKDPGAERAPILSLVGPPGSGKSWLLARIRQTQETKDAFVLHLDARQLIDPEQHDEIKREIIQKANVACANLNYPQDMLPSLPAFIADITQRLFARCASQRFLVLVDGCDDLASQEEFDLLQREYIRPFFGGQARCFRIIIARRLLLTDYILKKLSQRLVVGAFENITEMETHRSKLLGQLPGSVDSWPTLPNGCNYRWNHPYINCYLMYSSQDEGITTGILANCCRAVIERSILGNPVGHQAPVAEDLRKLALMTKKYANGWTSNDFIATFAEDLDFEYLRRGLISARQADDDMSGPTYRIVDGLRELLAALPEKELRS